MPTMAPHEDMLRVFFFIISVGEIQDRDMLILQIWLREATKIWVHKVSTSPDYLQNIRTYLISSLKQ